MMELVETLLSKMNELGATDLNLTESDAPVYRVRGTLRRVGNVLRRGDLQKIVETVTGGRNALVSLYEPKEIDGSYVFIEKGKKRYYRYNVSLSESRIHVTVRRLISEAPNLDEIGMTGADDAKFLKICRSLPEGLILVAGPTGSGKSTTMAAVIHEILKNSSIKVVTLEEPIEFRFPKESYPDSVVIQREIGKDTESFYEGLRAAMRQNPDVIFVGEIRDAKTAEAAIAAAVTGHTVFGTIHAKSPSEAAERLRGLNGDYVHGIPLAAVMKQRLVKDGGGVAALREYLFF